jgi:ArsR family transcriptional regulator
MQTRGCRLRHLRTETMKRGTIVARLLKSEVTALGKALSDPNRLSIYIEIAGRKELYVSELSACRVLSNATVSHHLRVLTQAGLVMFRHSGQNVFYRAVPAQLIRYCSYLRKLVEPNCSSDAVIFTSTLE